MTSEGSQIDYDLNIYFVITHKQKDENDCSKDMWHAYNSCDEHELSPKWIQEKMCNTLAPGKKDVFVMEDFEGPTFDKLSKLKCFRIVGPRCLLSCFMTGEPIPEGNSPIFTTAMRGLTVSVSGLSPEAKEKVGQKVEYMGGVFTRQFRSSVTHLVANFVMSAKYEAAIEAKIPIMTEEWVTAVWEASLVENVRATSSRFDKYKCPVFMNLVVTSTNLSKRRKEQIEQLIHAHGGVFMRILDGEKVKIVIAPEKSVHSQKLMYALQNNIACVKPEWVEESIKHGYALPFSNFLITSTKGSSTPKKSLGDIPLDFSTISTIQGVAPNNCIDETRMSTMSSTMNRTHMELKAAYVEVLTRLNIQAAKKAGPFLDGCNIYLTGFTLDHREKLNRILNVGSATRLDNISDAVTHVIVGDQNKASVEMKQMKSMGLSPHFLTVNWLEESIKLKSTAPEEDFMLDIDEGTSGQQRTEPPSPLSKKNLQLLQKPKRPPIPKFDIDKESYSHKPIEQSDLIEEYRTSNAPGPSKKSIQQLLGSTIKMTHLEDEISRNVGNNSEDNNSSTLRENDHQVSMTNRYSKNTNTSVDRGDNKERLTEWANDSSRPQTQPSEINERVLEGLTFVLAGFDQDQENLVENIETMGGRVVPSFFKGIPDFAVVPLLGAPLRHTVNEIVTELFIDDCIDQDTVVEVKYYHKPISISQNIAPLADCVIAMSSYIGKERTFLSSVAEALGARTQDTFARRTYPERNTYGCSHLVCPTPEGSKYNAAVKWKLPAVTADWLLACLAQQRRVPETAYLVGESIAQETPKESNQETPNQTKKSNSLSGPPSDSNVRQIITPKRQLPLPQASGTAPGTTPGITPINKRLNISDYKTPPSPFHVSTPDTPYGQFLKPNPSPDTRKRWLKWADDLPDMRVVEPPLKRRAPSTPLSELKRQLWTKMKEPLDGKNEQALETDEKSINGSVESQRVSQNRSISSSSATSNAQIPKELSFGEENSPTKTDQINLQLAQLDQLLQASKSETRHSLSSESAKQAIYDSEPTDHIPKCAVKDSQLDTVGWEDPVHTALRRKSTVPEETEAEVGADTENVEEITLRESVDKVTSKKRTFMLSGIKERSNYEQVILALGGSVSTEAHFVPTATHLLCVKPARNEKLLSSIAAGLWILSHHYLRDCEAEGRFLDEENYEWGNPKSKNINPEPATETERQLAAAAHRWRLWSLENLGGAFHDMVALLIGPEEKCQQFERVIRAGGGKVVEAKPPYNMNSKSEKITHCFIQVKQVDQPVDWAMMASKGILCFLPQFLCDQLTAEQPLNPRECVLPEFRKYLSLLPK
ncbi:DNA topoisomerase 2-binding protein 1-A isoform X1 [Athalia rosae]|uniref:DNA topoisomerase 2-binding protein 1-A isoform X1 n=1 Tax=Athalia rosae TaxID=37344 RepID=UPI0020341264|nr:DNA topoisomerase 2-binding protein 1-A isoform X1 [Athalia rosae]XP_012256498.2 DNA topoisomerase 2-binding protein 1-A isoform X1 [Athalia rosae]